MKIFTFFFPKTEGRENSPVFLCHAHSNVTAYTIGQVESRHIPGFSYISSYGSWEVAFSPGTRLFHSSMEFHGGLQFLGCFAKLQL